MSSGRINGKFPVTNWGLVEDAATSPANRSTANHFLSLYLSPLLAHLVLSKGIARDQAEDLLQGFVTDKLLTSNLLVRADPNRGRFRTFLLTALNNYVISEFRKTQSQRKCPGPNALISLETDAEQIACKTIPPGVETFDLAWAREVIIEALRRVERECRHSNKESHWLLFEDRIVQPTLHGISPSPYAEIIARLKFGSPIQAANAVFTVKRIFKRQFHAVLKEYSGEAGNVGNEINELYAILAGVRA